MSGKSMELSESMSVLRFAFKRSASANVASDDAEPWSFRAPMLHFDKFSEVMLGYLPMDCMAKWKCSSGIPDAFEVRLRPSHHSLSTYADDKSRDVGGTEADSISVYHDGGVVVRKVVAGTGTLPISKYT